MTRPIFNKYRDKPTKRWIVTWHDMPFGSAATRTNAENIICNWINYFFQYPERTVQLLQKLTTQVKDGTLTA